MSKITILFVIVGLACCVNAQSPFALFNGFFGSKGFNIPKPDPEAILNLKPGNNGNVQGSYMESSYSSDPENGVQRLTKIITNNNGDVKEYESKN